MSANAWLAKARALDRYRWLLLRERHGLLGSALRFAREACEDWWFGVRARRRLSGTSMAQSCDFLLLQSMPKVIPLQRKKLLKDALTSRGYVLVETALQEPSVILRERMLRLPPFPVPARYFAYAAHAEWLVEHYQPGILLNDRNGSLYTPFLRLALNARQRLLVHLAHATTVESSRRLGMNDYDFYFLFGQSSLEALQARNLRFGSSMAVLAGSHMVDRSYDLAPSSPDTRILLVLGVGPDKEKEVGYQATYALLRDWAVARPDYRVLIKAHPRSRGSFWHDVAAELDNVQVLPCECGLAAALRQASIVVNIMSNAVIEAALARRPIIYVNAGADLDIFSQERYLGARVSCLQKFSQRIDEVTDEYELHVRRSAVLAEYHLAYGCDGLSHCLSLLNSLRHGESIGGEVLPAKLQRGQVMDEGMRPGCTGAEFFSRAYVINLDRRQDRWRRMSTNLERIGMEGMRFSAIDAEKLPMMSDSPSELLRAFLLRVDGPRDSSEHKLWATWACMRSHLAIIRMAKEQDLPYVLILEDDCEFELYAREVLRRVGLQLQGRPWQMVYLGGTHKKGGQRFTVSENLQQVSRVRLAHAYMVHSSLYDRILDEAPESGLPLDWYYSERLLPSIEAYMIRPVLAFQRMFDMSDIEQVARQPKRKTRQMLKRWLATLRYGRS